MSLAMAASWIITAVAAFFAATWLGKRWIPLLHRLKFGQTIREEGPAWHKAKQGTPTMGGIIFIAAMLGVTVLAMAICQCIPGLRVVEPLHTVGDITRLFAGLLMALGFGAIGFADDYIKVVKKRNLGLTSRQKLAAQIALGLLYAAALYFSGATRLYIPFVGWWDARGWIFPIAVFILTGATNATNLTDGVDGLCGSVTLVVMLLFLTLCSHALGYGLLCAAMAGALAGFLVWNFHPARVFMGDTGSLFIGGVICAVAFGMGHPFLLIPFGMVYIVETVSVMMQVSYFKLTHGKRLFKMTPIHHHFELCGWSENKIVLVFSAVTLIAGIVGILLIGC